MINVTHRISEIKQPRGGYLPLKSFEKIQLYDGKELRNKDNISSSLIGLVVEYLTRYCTGASVREAFFVSISGSRIKKQSEMAEKLADHITGLDANSIVNACKLAGYDTCAKGGIEYYVPIEEINPNCDVIHDIQIMVERCKYFFDLYGPITQSGFEVNSKERSVVSQGEIDFLTLEGLWDIKVRKKRLESRDTLQILMYYILGLNSEYQEFQKIRYLGFFNPRRNEIYRISIDKIPQDVIEIVSHDAIGYGWTKEELDSYEREHWPEFCVTTNDEETRKNAEQEKSVYRNIVHEKVASEQRFMSKKALSELHVESDLPKLDEKIIHSKFGKGTIVQIQDGKAGAEVVINFETFGEKRLLWPLIEKMIVRSLPD